MANIAFISFYSGVVDRGVETFVHELADRLSKKHKITIFQAGSTINNPAVRTYQIISNAKIPKSTINPLAKIYLDPQSLKILLFTTKAIPKLMRGKYDLIIPLNGGWQVAICKLLSAFMNFKIMVTGQAGIGSDDAWNLFFHPHIFIALTKAQTSWAKKLTNEVKISNIPNGVDLSKFHPKIMPKKINLPKPIIVCASALVPYKRIDLTIKAAAKANLSLLLLGDGQDHGSLDTLGKRLLKNRYLRLVVPHSEIPRYFRAGNIFSLVSKTEAFGISYIEALACNLPVVCTNDESRAEIIGDAGILTSPQDIDTYAKDLKIAANTNYRNKPYNQSLKFSWNKIAELYEREIRDLTSGKNI